ncbi:hypothetical protein [Zoogloea sp.]|uniref:hypothetical protein n=1 Tax=Zoogloea sp. TaxID=49181 RepID=UPI0025FB9F63|nr:hypothetical protein [Zoogloea sp.]MCK6396063.1 hypothetical protein [Zoogloea sp.]
MSDPRYFHNEPAQTLYWVLSEPRVEVVNSDTWRITQTAEVISAQNRRVDGRWELGTRDPRLEYFSQAQYGTQANALNAFEIRSPWGGEREIDEAEFLRLKSIYEAQAGGEQVRHPKQG